jgi:hypothetical protein
MWNKFSTPFSVNFASASEAAINPENNAVMLSEAKHLGFSP